MKIINPLPKSKRSQAVIEFLMTYGWVILVVLVTVGVLTYYEFWDTDRFVSEKCALSSGMLCSDFSYAPGSISLVIQNGQGFDINNVIVSITGCPGSANVSSLANGEKNIFVVACGPSSGKFTGTVNVGYIDYETGASHSKVGELVIKIP
jgi:hypothetical protein